MVPYSYSIPSNKLPFHQQDDDYSCGAACAQMVLHSLEPNLAALAVNYPLDQADLLSNIGSASSRSSIESSMDPPIVWFSAPDGLEGALKVYADNFYPGSGYFFTLRQFTDVDKAARAVCWYIDQYHKPVIVLVWGLQHWILVRGFTSSIKPTGPGGAAFSIGSFDLLNSSPSVLDTVGALFTHDDTDISDGCGTPGRGIVLNNLAYLPTTASPSSVLTDYLTGPVPVSSGSFWKGKYLIISVQK